MDEASVKKNMLAIRKAANLSQETVAERMGISRTSYWNLESGETEITINHVVAFASALKISPEEVLLGYVPQQIADQELQDPGTMYSSQMQSLVKDTSDELRSAADHTIAQFHRLEKKIEDLCYVAGTVYKDNKEEK